MLIENIKSPQDLKSLSTEELNALAEEIRNVIIERVSINGGHLASNLGVVELTIALHYVFNSPEDKIVWDVGHQAYPHKLLTGRFPLFPTLRQYGGMSGFPKISESPHDAFGTGHSSTSISAALGIAEARDQKGENFKVIAVIGDGAMTSGLAFEGLNHAGHLKKDLIVILNDNEMSISPNVGAMSNYLSKVITSSFFQKFRKETKALLEGIPKIGESVAKIAQRAEGSLKGFFLPGGLFEDLGFTYVGPIDGHDIPLLIETLRGTKEIKEPVLIHTVTKKGKGYKFSEDDPCVYHGTGPFDTNMGVRQEGLKDNVDLEQKAPKSDPAYSDVFGNALIEIAEGDKRVVAVTAAMKEGTGLAKFAEAFPERLYDVGIAEPHAATFAAGLATQGLRPVVAIYSTFLQRAYDEIVHDICLQNLPVIFAIDRAGVVGEDGPTHQGVFDISFLRHIPNLVFMAPKDGEELNAMMKFAVNHNGPSAIRYPRGKTCMPSDNNNNRLSEIKLGKAEILAEGEDVVIIAAGNTVAPCVKAAELLKNDNINSCVVNIRFIKPLDEDLIISLCKRVKRIVTVEENMLAGGFGSAILECLNNASLHDVKVKRIGIGDEFVEHGAQGILRKKYGLDEEGIYKTAKEFLK
ncbi:MAG TPA: 1-deoxy-D-xylulose-5-phosphate synthase [Nitrospiraceae bacterium]|nr:MAG: 1-deoxy-D-xylulose-5-phosphate synthase [Nitrospirae bacterium GWA2_46_11]OGW25870.1 MAG: 1-deoxy-D-xylulose-5-phosphate synthase [Nitrospirae bacterium GWB2_47_37]HAK89237.1 1-deoxy-D-xylulose-5-phosphate synthase [Nitrospiraceae bacterium]HCZ11918.1 1-deoxy-D-xylulose-5-phosphate synthase [Nitrospiraceae bacterium]